MEAGLNLIEAGGTLRIASSPTTAVGLGGETFVSFDQKAVKLLLAHERTARLFS
jgi:hypothetical protein